MVIIKTPRNRFFALIDFGLTLLAWLVFVYLLGAGVWSIILNGHLQADVLAAPIPSFADTLLLYLLVAAGIAAALVAWAQYNAIRFGPMARRQVVPARPLGVLLRRFGSNPVQAGTLHRCHRATIFHGQDGLIQAIEVKPEPNKRPVIRMLR